MHPVLRVEGVRKAYGRHEVLRGVDAVVGEGELIGIVGENGSGKTTLLEILAGKLSRDAGQVEVEGPLGYCPQRSLVFERLTVRENGRYFGAAYGQPSCEAVFEALARRYRFERYLDRQVAEVSGGTRQKLNLAIALLHEPRVLLLDEPYAGFDWETYLAFWDHAAELRRQGCAIVVVSHLVHDRDRLDRIHTIEEGVLRC